MDARRVSLHRGGARACRARRQRKAACADWAFVGVRESGRRSAAPAVGQRVRHSLLAVVTNAIVDVVVNNKRMPTHIVLRPQTWYRIVSDASVAHLFTLVPPALLGLPVILSTNITGTYVTGVNGASTGGTQARIVVMDARAQLFLNRTDMAIDRSAEAPLTPGGTTPNAFLNNETVFRGERRVGFTAARRPASVSIVHGTGLANTFA
jgi:hypothetical protein